MFLKVKKFRDKLFNNGTKNGDGEEKDMAMESGVDAVRVSSYMNSSKRSGEHHPKGPDDTIPVVVSPMGSGKSATFKSFTKPAGSGGSITSGNGVVPAVHINRPGGPVLSSSTGQAMTPTSSRRKSTPAALDMALRTAEGKAAVEELLNNQTVKKPMAFAQYFGAPSVTSPRNPGQPTPMLAPTQELPRQPLAVRLAGKATAPHPLQLDADQAKSNKSLASVQEAGELSPNRAAGAGASAVEQIRAQRANEADVAAAAPVPAPGRVRIAEEEPSHSKRNKLLALSPNLHAAMQRKYWSLSDYSIIRKMYTGYASTVYQATCKKSAEQVALKVYHMENLCELNHYQVYREIKVHATLQHQNIIHLFSAFQEGTDVVLVQEYAEGGDLYRLLHRNGGRLSERQAVEMVLHPFLLALHYLHTRGIMHRDVKPENVLFTEHRVLKLADFGLAIDLNEERAVTRAGTLDYMAPEVLRCPPKNLPQENKNNAYLHYNNSVDAWAVGVFAYELVVGFPPFAGETQLDSVDKIMHSTPEFPEKMTELAKSFICQALKKHPGDRPTVIEMLHHPWIRSYQRRASVLHMPASKTRRGSTAAYMEGSAGGAAPRVLSPVAASPTSASVLSAGALQSAGASNPSVTEHNPEDMTPEQIEEMIKKLMLAKQAAMERVSSGAGSEAAPGSPTARA